MNKRELKKWLENEKEEKLNKLKEEFDKAKSTLLLTQLESCGIDYLIEMAISLGEYAEAWVNTYGDRFGAYKYGYSVLASCSRLNKTSEKFKREIVSELDVSSLKRNNKEFMELTRKYEETKTGVSNTYTALIANISTFKTSKEAVEYLKGLGMKVPEEDKVCTAMMVPVDTKYLFLGEK